MQCSFVSHTYTREKYSNENYSPLPSSGESLISINTHHCMKTKKKTSQRRLLLGNVQSLDVCFSDPASGVVVFLASKCKYI